MAEVIVTEFRAETGQFVASIDDAERAVMGLDKVEKDAQKSTQGLSQQLGSAAGKANAHKVAMTEVGKSTAAAAVGAGDLSRKLADADFSGATADSRALATVLLSLGEGGVQVFDNLKLSATDTVELLRELVAEAAKTPEGAAALATGLNEVQISAIAALQATGALNASEAELVAQALKLGAANKTIPPEVEKAGKAYVSLRTQMQNAKRELDRLVDASDGNITPEFVAAAKKAGELQDRLEDINATVQAFNPDAKFAAFSGVVTNIAGGFTAVQGAMALLGGESESVERGLLKVQSALAISQGLQSLFGGLKDNLANLRLVLTSSATGATAFSGAVGGARAAMLSLNTAIASNPFGAVAIAVIALGAALYGLSSSMKQVEIDGKGLVETLDHIVKLRADALKSDIDDTSQDRELAHAEAMRDIEEQRAKINASGASQEQKAIQLQVLSDRAATLDRKKSREDLAATSVAVDRSVIQSTNARLSVELKLAQAYKQVGATYIGQARIQGQALEDASAAGAKFGINEARALEERSMLLSRLDEDGVEQLKALEEARDKYLGQEQADLIKSQAVWSQRSVAAVDDEAAITQANSRQADLRQKLREAEETKRAAAAAKIAAAEKGLADVIREIDATLSDAMLSESDRRGAAIVASFGKQKDAVRAAFAEVSKLAAPGDQKEIEERQAAEILKLDTALKAALAKLREEDIEGVRSYAKTKEEIQTEEVNKQFDAQRSETERLIEDGAERTEILLAIEKNRQEALSGIRVDADAERLAQQQATQKAEIAAIGAFAQASAGLLFGMAQGQEDAAQKFSKAALSIAFDTINAMVPIWVAQATGTSLVQLDSVATFGTAGIARAAVLTALIRGVLAGLRGTLGFATGGEVTRGWGPPISRGNGDNVLATLQDREIVLSRASRARAERVFGKGVWGSLGVPGFGGSIDWSAALARAGASTAARDGGVSPVAGPRDDRRIIGALGGVGSLREQRRQTELLEELARTRGRNPRSRWA